ncbi:uncharacterized protein UDID_20226 [Ustilago sp. UG-2017a]|nr:uncharacterized protein UDID_20226 [Ustilago sp. UG-2017a]
MNGEERADYFTQGRRRYVGRDSGRGDTEASAMPMGTPTGYSTEQGSSQFTRAMPQSQGQRSADFAPGMSPSVLSPGTGYGHHAIYAAGGAHQQQEQHQQRMNAQEMQRQAQASMSGMQGVSPVEQMQGMQLRVTTPYDGCSYGESMMQGAPGQSRMEAASAIYHHQPLQQGGSYAFAQTPSQTQSQQAQYRSHQTTSPQYPSQQQQHQYGQQRPYSGQQ